MPIWMGVRSSVAQRIIERLDGTTHTVMCEKNRPIPTLWLCLWLRCHRQ